MTITAVFIVNGLGLGNSTRCHAVMQRLVRQGVRIHVVTSGNGKWYFGDCGDIESLTEVSSLYYSKKAGKISIANTLASVVDFSRILRGNGRRISTLLDDVRPDIVVTDSEYTFWPVRVRGIPHVAINNSDVVVSGYRTYGNTPRSIRSQYRFVEYNDYLFHKTVPRFSISPTLDPGIPAICDNYLRVGPIVRDQYVATPYGAPSRVTVTLSGSAFGSQIRLDKMSYPVDIDVIGRDQPEGWSGGNRVHYHGKIKDTLPLLSKTDLAVVNGGFSAISEAFYMRKPLVVVPVPNHAEQWINARTIERLGVGVMASEDDIEGGMLRALDHIDGYRKAYENLGEIPDGAAQAADAIVKLVRP